MATFLKSATILEVNDVTVSEAFYREKLGFAPGNFFGEPPTFCVMGRDAVTLLLDVDDVDAVAAEIAARGVPFEREIETQDYGCRDFDVRDPDGHIVGIGQVLKG